MENSEASAARDLGSLLTFGITATAEPTPPRAARTVTFLEAGTVVAVQTIDLTDVATTSLSRPDTLVGACRGGYKSMATVSHECGFMRSCRRG